MLGGILITMGMHNLEHLLILITHFILITQKDFCMTAGYKIAKETGYILMIMES